MKSNKIAYMGLMIALAFVLSYIEVLIPFQIGIYGAKLGLANLVIVLALYRTGFRDALSLSVVRIFLVGITFGSLYGVLYSLVGTSLSLVFMYLLKSTKKFTIIGVSAVGGVMHNIGQLIVAVLLLQTFGVIYYASVLIVCGVITGIIIGIITQYVQEHLKHFI